MNSAKFAKIITVKTPNAILILSLVLMAILYPSSIIASGDLPVLPNAGLTPLNGFYFIDQWSEAVQQFFAISPEAKIKLQLSLIAERIAEMKIVVEKKDAEASEVKAIRDSIQQRLDLIAEIISKEQQKGKDTGDLQQIAQAGIDDTKRVLSDVLGQNQQQLQDEILDNLISVSGVTADLKESSSKDEQEILSENLEADNSSQDKNSEELKAQSGVKTLTQQLVISTPTITTSSGQSSVTPTPSLTPTPTPVPSVYISEKNCSLYFVKNGSEVLITTDDYGFCPGQPDFIQSGDSYGVVWRENRAGTETAQIYFKKIDPNGQSLTGDIKLTQAISGRGWPLIVWTGSEYGIAWLDDRDDVSNPSPDSWVYGNNSEVYFVRIDNGGGKIGNESRITYCVQYCGGAELSWNAAGYYDLSWVEGALTPHSAKLDSSGNIIQ